MSDNAFLGATEQPKRFEFKRLGYYLMMEISPGGLICECTYEPSPSGAPLAFEELQNYLAQSKVREGINDEAISELLSAATSQIALFGLTLAHGIPMVPGEDGAIQLAVSDSLKTDNPEDDELSNVDFRIIQEFLNVAPGQLIGTILPPGKGSPGRGVSGADIPAKPGMPLDIILGQNVRLGDDGSSLYAEAEGRVYTNGKEISVEDIYTVKGDVDFKVGNIVYNGFLDVSGDVLDGFTIKATKGIKVHGNIGVCAIESEGDIIFCGMNGQGKGSIKSGGNIAANFINDVIVEAKGNVTVESEIRNCLIKSLGFIRVNKGMVSGGEYVALAGLEANIVGSNSSLRTNIVVGVHYSDQEELTFLFNEMKQLITSFNANRQSADHKVFAKERSSIADRLQEVRSRKHADSNPKVNIKKVLYEGVCITLASPTEEIKEARKGPMSIIENTMDGGFRYLSLTELNIKAEDIERAFVQQGEFSRRRSLVKN